MNARYEVWTRVNSEDVRVYIGVQLDGDGFVVAATQAYRTADEAADGMHLYGMQAAWVARNAGSFERAS